MDMIRLRRLSQNHPETPAFQAKFHFRDESGVEEEEEEEEEDDGDGGSEEDGLGYSE